MLQSQRNITDPSVVVTDSLATEYDSTDESLVYSPCSSMKKLTVAYVLIILCLAWMSLLDLCEVYFPGRYDHDTNGHNMIISLEREINPRNPQHVFKRCKACGSSNHTTTDHYDIKWFKRGEALHAKKAEALKSTKAESSNANRSKTPTKSGCSRHMTGVKSYLHKYVEQPGPKVVFGDDSTCTTEGYGSIKCNGIVFTKYSRYAWVYFLKKKSQAPETIMSFIKRVENQNDIKVKQLRTNNGTEFKNSILVNFCDEKGISQNFSSPYTPEQNGVAERKNRTLIEAARTMLSGSAFRVFNTRRQQIEETYHITFNESPKAIKFSKPSVDNINIAKTERYPPDEYLHPYEPSQRYQTNNNDVSFIEPYECPEPVVLETEVSSNQNGHLDQNDEILNDDHSEHSNHTNDGQIIDNLPNTKDIQISEHLSSPNVEDTSAQNTIPIPPPLPIPSVVTPVP
ncbi:retrovirus-related pol polyprotein from transposon TNT 1-94 [Tanacetum coccineum]|uniref:Retrovirus-related pol polyprotein from transposon TNT 1-94 n=1 Tax=Tanacetum coccineum TaxID=301880 RepID=A0ABQ5IV49_9ASTR